MTAIVGLRELAEAFSAAQAATIGVGDPGVITNPLRSTGERCPRCGGALLADVSEPPAFDLAEKALDGDVYRRLTVSCRVTCAAGCDWRGWAFRSGS